MKVSCIVSAYFAEAFIEGRIENLLEQTEVEFEVLVACMEGSAEHEILKRFGDAITLVTTSEIPTIYATWNELIQLATGEYITNSNSDDRLYPGALYVLSKALDDNPEVGIVYANTDIVRQLEGDPVNRHLWIEGGMFELIHGCFVGPMPMWRKSLHEVYGLFDTEMKSAGDYEFWLRVVSRGIKMKHLNYVVGAYLRRPDSAERREGLRTIWETARARSRYVDWRTLYAQETV